MAKEKTKGGTANRHLHARTVFLQQAAAYLASSAAAQDASTTGTIDKVDQGKDLVDREAPATTGYPVQVDIPSSQVLPVYLNAHLQQVARKSQIRLKADVKHSICKRCHAVLSAPDASFRHTENLSRNRSKPHADVLVITCKACAATKRFPVGAVRQKRKTERGGDPGEQASNGNIVQMHGDHQKSAPNEGEVHI